jgi:HEAT repeat protein/predicted protein tyrosine phosphatase
MSENPEQITEKLLQYLANGQPQIQRMAAIRLAKIGNEMTVSGLINLLSNHENERLQAWTAWTLSKIATKTVVNQVITLLNHNQSQVRIWSVWILEKVPNLTAIKVVVNLLSDPDPQMRWRSAFILGKIAILLRNKSSNDPKSKAILSTIIWRLLPLLKDRDYYVRARVAMILGDLGEKATVKHLLPLLNESKFYVICKTAEAIGKIGGDEAVNGLISYLKHHDIDVRGLAVSALGTIGNDQAFAAILETVKDQDLFVRGRAINALGEIGHESAKKIIISALNDPELYVRSRANEVLENMEINQLKIINNSSNNNEDHINIIVTSYSEAREYIYKQNTVIHHIISIGSPGTLPPSGFAQVSNKLRLEFDDIETPRDDLEYVLPDYRDLIKIIKFAPTIYQQKGNVLVHCQAGISRSAAIAVIVWAILLGENHEEEALKKVLEVRPQASPNQWIIELADDFLGRKGKLIKVMQKFYNQPFN